MLRSASVLSCLLIGGCVPSSSPQEHGSPGTALSRKEPGRPSLPLVWIADAPLPGRAVRFDYQALDPGQVRLVIAHMNDASVVVVKATDGSVVKVVRNVPRPRGVAVADEVGRIFVTSSPDTLVILDHHSLDEIARVRTGSTPDGVSWDPVHRIVAVSDQGDGAVSLVQDSGSGARQSVKLGQETGNVVFDGRLAAFWVTVVTGSGPDELVCVDPLGARSVRRLPLPGCSGAHGLVLHPDGASAFVACERNAKLARVDLSARSTGILLADCGDEPDVLAIDATLAWLYVAAESSDVRVFDIALPGLVAIGRARPGDAAHSVVVDPKTHHVYFPLQRGPGGTPVLRIMKPSGT